MKTSIVFMLVSAIMLTGTISSCTPASDNSEEEKEKIEAEKKAEEDFQAEVQEYKMTVREEIEENDRKIDLLKENIKTVGAEMKENFQEQVEALEQRNAALKVRLNEFSEQSRENWEEFKTEFNRDMNELGTAIKNLFVDNEKQAKGY